MKDDESYTRAEFYRDIVSLNKAFNLAEINLTAKDLAYFAGIFDTEVYYGIGEPYTLNLSYNKQSRELLKLVSNSFGGKIHKVKIQPFHSKQIWVWQLSSNHAYKVLKKYTPFYELNESEQDYVLSVTRGAHNLGCLRVKSIKLANPIVNAYRAVKQNLNNDLITVAYPI